jgi:hypothetical protein
MPGDQLQCLRAAHGRVVVADAATGHGDTLDELTLLSAQAGAASVAASVLLSRLSEGCEDAFDTRLRAGFARLFSLPVRPITVHNRSQCTMCERRDNLQEAVTELPAGPVRELAKQLASAPRFRRRADKSEPPSVRIARQIALFPLERCRRGVASGIALHALHAAMWNGMAHLSLPELTYDNIPPGTGPPWLRTSPRERWNGADSRWLRSSARTSEKGTTGRSGWPSST